MDEIADVKEKVTVESFIGSMATEMEKFSFEAEKEQKWSLLSKAKSYGETVKQKKRTLSTLNETLKKLDKLCQLG